MAASYVVIDQAPFTKVLGPNQVIATQRVDFVTRPSGVTAARYVPLQAWEDGGADAWIEPLATAIENMLAGGLASYASWLQDSDPATGLLRDAIAFVVTYDPGDGRPVMEAIATVPVASLTLDAQFGGVLATYFGGGGSELDPQQAVRDVYDALVTTANL